MPTHRPIIWSIAGNDSAGGAGLSADMRAADAFGVHLCPIATAVTAQNSCAVQAINSVSSSILDSQIAALAQDHSPRVIKTGLLASAQNIQVVAKWVNALRARAPLALVVDPVLQSSTGALFCDAQAQEALTDLLIPRATVITPNQREAQTLTAVQPQTHSAHMAAKLRNLGAQAVCITGGDEGHKQQRVAADWIDTSHASGWLALARQNTRHTHGTGCTFASSVAAALALGYVPADALVLAKMSTAWALEKGYEAGQGAGPVCAGPGFGPLPHLLPFLSWSDDLDLLSWWQTIQAYWRFHRPPTVEPELGLYALVDSPERLKQTLIAGVRTLQLRIKQPQALSRQAQLQWFASLKATLIECIALCEKCGARLFVNDWADLAMECIATNDRYRTTLGLHLGQEDLSALGSQGRETVRGCGIDLGVSSHSLWELARARSMSPFYIACGPIWPTTTKDMPWQAQGLDNLKWWRTMAGRAVVAIGGILTPEQYKLAVETRVSGVCLVRALGQDPCLTLPAFEKALERDLILTHISAPELPHPSLKNGF